MSYPLRVYVGLKRPRGREMLIGHHESPLLWTVILALTRFRNFVQIWIQFALFRCKMSDVLNLESPNPKLLHVLFFKFLTWTNYTMSPRREWHVLVQFSSPPYRACSYHVAQLPIGGLWILNIRAKSKSKYPVTKLFENAQPYYSVTIWWGEAKVKWNCAEVINWCIYTIAWGIKPVCVCLI